MGNCQTSDGINNPTCCLDVTPSPTPEPSPAPTRAPTCPDYSSNSDPCSKYTQACCPTDICTFSTSAICQSEGGPNCCQVITTTGRPTTSTAEPTTSTAEPSYPTPRPTLKSAMKWEMIHPQYSGSDGELLWHVYYGDFSDDERFDQFRADE